VPLFVDEPHLKLEKGVSRDTIGEAVGRVTNRQLLMYLAPGQTISFKAVARKGLGEDHAKWSPVTGSGGCYYRPLFDVQLNTAKTKQLSSAEKKGLVGSCPQKVFDIEDGDVIVKNSDKCDACRNCLKWAATEHPELLKVPEQHEEV
jgi:DNA-directed RNA polymerase subunit D